MDLLNCPCKDCTSRWAKDGRSCHSVCPKYLGAVERHQKCKEAIFKNSMADREYLSSQTEGVLRERYVRDKLRKAKRGRQTRV